eukprot:TRINITY_DN781_c0_g1_i2.p1 TRINITY_DN781_c0_g1~~TRINITY_DN781_c0_g1_i2.p1  ORF type:complete len:252 (-),score=46.84 TRINITY_DN781_c0_g1_i2:378-1133(-)
MAEEFSLLVDGLRIQGKRWGPADGKRILALHGWLDNAATWDALAPLLAERGYLVVCPDFVGHGKSDHIPNITGYSMEIYLTSIYMISLALGWESFILMSHSMGGSIATLFAGAMPGLVESLIIFESLGPWTMSYLKPQKMELELMKYPDLLKVRAKVYPTEEAAVLKLIEKNSDIEKESARIIVSRSLQKVKDGFSFSHDSKLLGGTVRPWEESEVESFIRRIRCPVLLFWTKKTFTKFESTLCALLRKKL